MVLETRIGLDHEHETMAVIGLARAKASFIQAMFAALRSICSASISGARPKLSLLPTMCLVAKVTPPSDQEDFRQIWRARDRLSGFELGLCAGQDCDIQGRTWRAP